MKRTRNQTMLIAASLSLVVMSACGSDTNDATSSDATTGAVSADAVGTDACDTWIAADAATIGFFMAQRGDPTSVNAALDAAIDAAPPDNSPRLVSLKDAVQPMLATPDADTPDATQQLYDDSLAWASDNCDVSTLDVSAEEYQYSGLPDTLPTGYTVVHFSNDGNESHEMFAFRIDDSVTGPVQDLFDLPEEEAMKKISPVNASFADPGGSDTESWDLTEPGRYAVVCFIPTGTTPGNEGSGPPHFAQGMVQEFTVTP